MWWIILVIGIGMWLLSWIRKVGLSEMGNKYFLNSMGKKDWGESCGLFYGFCDSGLHLVPRLPFCGIKTVPKTRFKLDYAPRLVISKRTTWEEEEKFGKQFLIIDAVIYIEFRRNWISVKKAIERKIPTTEKGLVIFTDALIDSACRLAIGDMSWGEATEKEGREKIKNIVIKAIKDENSVFQLGGFDIEKTDTRIKTVDLQSKKLKEAITQPDIERLQAEGAEYEAERLKRETEVIGEIREKLIEAGFSEEKVDEICHAIYELQVSKDLQVDTGMPVVKLIRFQSSNPFLATLTEGIFALGEGKKLTDRSIKKEQKDELTPEEIRKRLGQSE